MLEIRLTNVAKRFQYDWIFRNLDLHVKPKDKIAITGSNGSGKSTFLKCLAGTNPFTEGKASYLLGQQEITENEIYQHLAISAPYMELPEEFSLLELLKFHFNFKSAHPGMGFDEMIKAMYLEEATHKQLSFFSSGMKQRVKLGLCFFSNAPLLLLDEPTSNLDSKGSEWYKDLVQQYGHDRTVFVASNSPYEYDFCNQQLHIEDYKLKKQL
ncbi:ABC transporter ATP-binding protein [Echinicola strongylocentroti]|uniref:ABC transporter ATP-binding protein n=1 Tax=Echinicola strongylocentroti TaxID=1795355 RepID=A0A2Z4IL52_9BACT|nr:ATP-binding cassette domain-containing protein [Echinicola strongylocentroti]AWW31675.1 ABC transporter ATP-binding protein [Echinicola strongylocentroti]